MILRRAWHIGGWCTRQSARLVLWSTWIVLLLALAGQIHLLSSRRVPVPEPVRRMVAERLAVHGLRLDYGRSRMDFAGRLLLENVRFGPADGVTSFATAHSVYVRVDPWRLLTGDFQLREARIDGLDLDQLAERIDLSFRTVGNDIELSYLNGYIGRLPVQAHGRFHLPAARDYSRETTTHGSRLTDTWTQLALHARTLETWLAAADAPRLHLRLDGQNLDVTFDARSINLAALPVAGDASGTLTGISAHTVLPLGSSLSTPLTLTGALDTLDLPRDITASGLVFALRTTAAFDAPVLDLQLDSARWREISTGPAIATLTQPVRGDWAADLSLRLAGGNWRLQAAATPATGHARVILDGFVGDATLAFAGNLIQRDLTKLLDPEHAAPVHAEAAFGPGWKLTRASGRLHSGTVLVGGALLDETGTEFYYDGSRVLADALVLRQGPSLAHGSYEMDTRTMDFRFLLTGGLHPEGISRWFHAWWTNFWSTFDFSHYLPDADVDVRGRWGDLTATNVFVQAAGGRTGLKGVEFDRVRTRLYLRPHWFDILHFEVARDAHEATGSLARSLDLQKNTWTRMDFAVDSTLPLTTISQLFPAESAELLAPYHFTSPPVLNLRGNVISAASPDGKSEYIDIGLKSSGAMTYHDFPLSDLVFQARLRDDRIDLPALSVGFAGGQARGDARLWGAAGQRRLAFDIALTDADLAAVTDSISRLQPAPSAPLSAKALETARLRQQRLEGGRLDFQLKAEGAFADFYSFKGSGRGEITNAELGQLNLFGPLSEALRGTFINFSSFSLTTVDAPFVLDGERVIFKDLRVTGPSALLLAKGDYHLRNSRLDFATKLHPFDESTSLFGNAANFVFTPLSKVFEVKLQGTLSQPAWIFAYGPSRWLNTLTGGTPAPASPTPLLEEKTP